MSESEGSVVGSPCRSLCKLDSNNICLGCFRKSVEINFWTTYSNEEKLEIIRKTEQRRLAAEQEGSPSD